MMTIYGRQRSRNQSFSSPAALIKLNPSEQIRGSIVYGTFWIVNNERNINDR